MKNQFLPVLRFAVCSDSHIEGKDSPGYVRLKRAIDYSLSFASADSEYNRLDAFFIAGDITNKGTKEEFDAFKEIYDYAKSKGLTPLCTVAKGHDSITMKKKSLSYFKALTNQKPDFHKVIGGFHFIGLSTCKINNVYYTPYQRFWLIKNLKSAVRSSPDKPVFLFHHEHVKYTVYGSSAVDGWGNLFFTEMLKKFPNVVDFSGHSHYPVNDPRSIWQKEYTAMGTGSLKYTELTVDGEKRIHPETFEQCANFLIVEADKDNNLHITGIDCLAQQVLCEYYLKNPADKSNRDYTEEKQLSRSLPPFFSEDAQITLTKKGNEFFAEYPKAESSDGMPVFIYRAFVTDEKGKTVAQGKTVPSYYLFKSEDRLATGLGELPRGSFRLKILAETAYGIQSECIEKTIEI